MKASHRALMTNSQPPLLLVHKRRSKLCRNVEGVRLANTISTFSQLTTRVELLEAVVFSAACGYAACSERKFLARTPLERQQKSHPKVAVPRIRLKCRWLSVWAADEIVA